MTLPDQQPTTDPETSEGLALRLADGDIHVYQDGPATAPVLLLIHGSASSSRSFYALVPLLTGSHRVIRVDLSGHGRSPEPADGGYDIGDQARRIGAVLDRLGVTNAVVAGHSSGGYAATALAEQRPDLVTALVLINTGPSLDAFIAPPAAEIQPSQWPPSDEQLLQFASTGFSRPGFQIPLQLLEDVRGMSLRALGTAMQASRAYVDQRSVPDRLAALAKPLLVIFGDQDRRWRPASADDYRAVPDARVEMLPGIGHSPILEDPQRTAELILAFTATRTAR